MSKNSYISFSSIRDCKYRMLVAIFLLGGFLKLMCPQTSSLASYEGKTVIDVNNAFVPTGWMGDTKSLHLNTNSTDTFHSYPDSIKIEYDPVEGNWAGIYWQTPPGNWGSNSGLDLSGATKLTFWARGARGGEVVEFLAGGINSPGSKYKDSFHASTKRIELPAIWKKYAIDLENHTLSNVIGGFAFVIASQKIQSEKSVFYLDDIRYEWKDKMEGEKLSVDILEPRNGEAVRKTVIVKGTAIIPTSAHLWVLARREDYEGLWWPQGEGKINPKNNEWQVSVVLGIQGDIGWDFDIVAIIVGEKSHVILSNYLINGMKTGDWRPLEIPTILAAPVLRKVKKLGH